MYTYAGFWRRFFASLIDMTILLFSVSIFIAIGHVFIGGLISLLYFSLFESSSKEATIGKMILGIKVTDLNGNRISFLRAIGRFSCKSISSELFLFGDIMVAFTEKKQGYHDIVANTLVIKKPLNIDKEKDIENHSIDKSLVKPFYIKFISKLLIILALFFPLSVIPTYLTNKPNLSQLAITILFSIISISSGIGLIFHKKWSWWLGCSMISLMLVSVINTFLVLPISIYQKLGFLPFFAFFLITLFWIYSEEVVVYLNILIKRNFRLYIIPCVFICLSVLFIIFRNLLA